MTYLAAPATALVASHCACCGKPLVDAVSVETGVGPDCRKKHGFGEAQGAADLAAAEPFAIRLKLAAPLLNIHAGLATPRDVANKAVHLIAREASGQEIDGAAIADALNLVRVLGFVKLADRIEKRLASVRIEERDGAVAVRSPYSPAFVEEVRRIAGRRWDAAEKVWTVPAGQKPALWHAIRRHYAGLYVASVKGVAPIPAVEKSAA